MDFSKIGVKLLAIILLAGVFSYLGGILLGTLTSVPYWAVISGVVLIGALMWIKNMVTLDDVDIFEEVILFALVGLVGTVVTMFVPAANAFILTLGQTFTWAGLGWTLLYIALGEYITNKFM